MKKIGLINVAVLLVLFFLPGHILASEAEDPYFTHWASFKIDSNVSLVGRVDDAAGSANFSQTLTLKEIFKDYLILEIARSEEKVASVVKKKRVNRFIKKTDKLEYNGQEEILVAGKNVSCKVYSLRVMDAVGKETITFKYWFNPEIPGYAKIVASAGKEQAVQTAVKWEKK